MKVAIVVESFPRLSETFILNQVASLVDLHVDVHIFAERPPSNEPRNEFFERSNLKNKITYDPVALTQPVKRIAGHAWLAVKLLLKKPFLFFKLIGYQGEFFNLRYLYALSNLEQYASFDIVHAHFGPVGVKVCNLQSLGFFQGPLICSFHGYDVDRNDFRSNPGFYSVLFKKASLITANSQYTLKNIHALGCEYDKLVVLPESLRTEYFKPFIKETDKNIVRILTVARLVEFKGIEYSIKAIHELLRSHISNVHYTIIGTGELSESLQSLVSKLGVEDQVTFLGAQSQEYILNEMNRSDIFLLTGITAADGRQENQGLVLQEAQSMQLPVVASLVGGVGEGILDGTTGFLVREKDYITVAQRLAELVNNDMLRKQMGVEGRKFVLQNFDSAFITSKLYEFYRKM